MLKLCAGALLALAISSQALTATGKVADTDIRSKALEGNLIGLDPLRRIKVYLPAGYDRGSTRYPVLYYIHNYHWSPERTFKENRLHEFVEQAVARGQLGELIVVAGDFTTPTGFNFFGNDVVAGR